uniref:Ig-like domain-containing protein n=1 Tax=Terrapene triunguis TaxID=2587831 RepID=A0A674JBW3_9SAUR
PACWAPLGLGGVQDGGGLGALAVLPSAGLRAEPFDCHYTNGTERVRLLVRNLYDRQQFVQFDSDLGVYVGETEVGRRWAEGWNKNQAHLAARRAEVDTVCRHNYGVVERFLIHRRVQPKVRVSPTKSGSQPHPHLLVCSVTGFYPGGIEIKWLKNGQEQTAGVVSTELLQNGDWTFQILVMLEMSPRRGDVYTCQVEHISLRGPLAVHWEAQSDSARSKMLTGVGGFVLGLIFLAALTMFLSVFQGAPFPNLQVISIPLPLLNPLPPH